MRCNLPSGSLITGGGALPACHRQRHGCRWAVSNLPAPRQCGGTRKADAVRPLGTGRHTSLNPAAPRNLFTEVVQAPEAGGEDALLRAATPLNPEPSPF